MSCTLGIINNGTNATAAMVVAVSTAGSMTDAATATNDQGSSATASATTLITAAASASAATTRAGPTATSVGTSAGSVTRTGANLQGRLVTGGQSTAYFFQYGRTPRYGQATGVHTLAGALTLARGTTKVAGCAGNLTIEITDGSTRLVSHTVKVSRTCSFESEFTVNEKLSAPGTLRARASFGGNQTLYGTKSKTITLRYG